MFDGFVFDEETIKWIFLIGIIILFIWAVKTGNLAVIIGKTGGA